MNTCARLLIVAVLTGVRLLCGTASAQVEGMGVFAETTCDGIQVDVQISLTIAEMPPPDIVGWVVEREVVGACVDVVVVGDVRPFPATPGTYEFVVRDIPVVPYRKVLYRIWAVDEYGGREFIYWPQRTNFAQADCMFGMAARGTVVDDEWYGLRVEVVFQIHSL